MISRFILGLVIVIITIPLVSLFSNGYMPLTHDQVQAERVYEFTRALVFGQFPVRWVENIGYGFGYPLFNFYAPFPYALGAIVFIFSGSLILSTKIMIAIGFILSFASMYLLAKKIWNSNAALVSAALYTLAPYHAVQLYVRGSIGELFAYGLLPLTILGLYEIEKEKPATKNIIVTTIATAALFLSHTITLYILALAFILYATIRLVIFNVQKNNMRKIGKWLSHLSILIGLPILLTTFFWLPAFSELSYTQLSLNSGNNVDYSKHFITLNQLWSSAWGYGGSAPGTDADGMTFMIGKLSLVCALISLVSIIKYKKIKKILPFLAIALVSIFLTNVFSEYIWTSVPYFTLIQFPWRFLMFINLGICIIASAFIPYIEKYKVLPVVLILIIVQTLFSFSNKGTHIKFFQPAGYYEVTTERLKEPEHLRWSASKISDEFFSKFTMKPLSEDDISTDTITCTKQCSISNAIFTPDRYQIQVANNELSVMHLDKAFFPGWKVFINNIPGDIHVSPTLGVTLPPGNNTVIFQLFDTPLRMIANMISITTFLFIIVIYLTKSYVRTRTT